MDSWRSAGLCACVSPCSSGMEGTICVRLYEVLLNVVVHEEVVHCIQLSYRHAPMSSAPTSAAGALDACTLHPDGPAMVYTVHTHHVRLAELGINYTSATYRTQQLALRRVRKSLLSLKTMVQADLILCSNSSAKDEETLKPQGGHSALPEAGPDEPHYVHLLRHLLLPGYKSRCHPF